jgi:hypothetical protein
MKELVLLFTGRANATNRAANEHCNSERYQDRWQKIAQP